MRSMRIFRMCFTVLVLGALISCDDDTGEVEDSVTLSNTELRLAVQVDATEDQSFAIVENAYVETEEVTRASLSSFFSSCAIITVTPNGTGGASIVVDFGIGCTLQNGAEAAGKVLLSYNAIQNNSRMITYTYEDFTYNDTAVSGGGTVIRQLENSNGNPQSFLSADVAFYFPAEDVVATRTLSRIREWIEGVGSGTWTDNAFLVTGNWNTSFSSGFNREGIVLTALRREASCPNFVSGTVGIIQNNINGVLDFGDGNCDATATVTVGGQTYTIQL